MSIHTANACFLRKTDGQSLMICKIYCGFDPRPAELNGIVRKAGVIALALAVFFGVKHFNKTRAGSAVEEGMELLLEKMPGYSENSEWYDGLFKDCYASSFDASYDIGSRRRAGRLKEREFLSSVFGCMEKKALSQGRPEEAATIQQMGKFTQAFIDEQK